MSGNNSKPKLRTGKKQAVTAPRPPRFAETDIVGPAYYGDRERVEKRIASRIDVNSTDPATGLSALHVAVGTNNLSLARLLVETHNAQFFPDRFGRWPSLIAIECEVSNELADYIVNAEARFLEARSG